MRPFRGFREQGSAVRKRTANSGADFGLVCHVYVFPHVDVYMNVDEHCYSTAPECRETLLKLKSTQDFQKSCVCPDPSSRSCQDFQNLVYNHPCLYQQRIHPAFFPQPANAFNFDLEFANQLLLQKHVVLSCPSALHACRKSPLCRRVYDEFRRRCKIKDGRCRMTK